MSRQYDRRHVLKAVSATCAAFILPGTGFADGGGFGPAEEDLEVRISSVSAHTFRVSVFAATRGGGTVPGDGSLLRESWDGPITKLSGEFAERGVKVGQLSVKISPRPLTFTISGADGGLIQQLKLDRGRGGFSSGRVIA